MKRRSLPKEKRRPERGYAEKRRSGAMMYGPAPRAVWENGRVEVRNPGAVRTLPTRGGKP